MPNLPHIILLRADFEEPRRRGGSGRQPLRDFREHGPALRRQLDAVVQAFQTAPVAEGIRPDLILRIQLHAGAVIDEETWTRCGLTLLSVEPDQTLVLFSSDEQLLQFRRRLNDYQTGPAEDQKNSPHSGIFANVDVIGAITPEDRIGRLCRARGMLETAHFQDGVRYTVLRRGRAEFPATNEPSATAPAIAIIDSGLTSAHPLLAPAVGEATAVPQSLGDGADAHGHGTLVGEIALYGDIEACIAIGAFVPKLRLFSIRVLNENCKFDDTALITTQMRDAISYLRASYGCRVFNLSLGDDTLPYQGGKVSPWASILDSLARELDILIVVSSGNFTYQARDDESPDAHYQRYPQYLLDDEARIIEPATGAIVLTVGALSRSSVVPFGAGAGDVALRPISREGEPSPFTRSGPGIANAIKPELCDIGGNRAYDGRLRQVRSLAELSLVSMNRDYLRHLFAANSGTSFAAPRAAHSAARLLETFPNASANLLRALLISSASVPIASSARLNGVSKDAVLRVSGYGVADLMRAQTSDENRVVLFSDSQIAHDRFHIYEIPIPDTFLNSRELRTVEITLAYDPPVRHSRFDYLGTTMSFTLIRGKLLSEVVEACEAQAGKEEAADRLTSTNWECKMEPSHRIREGGTLQRAIFQMKKNPRPEYGNTYHLVVRCERKWARDEHAPQRYAIAVVLRQYADVDIHQQIRQRLQARARIH